MARSKGFVAQLMASLATTSVTSTGGSGSSATGIAVAGSSVYVTGTVTGHDLPVTGDAIVPIFPGNSATTGFVETFTGSGATLAFASYLGGANGSTYPEGIAADASGNMYITGYDTATGFPTLNALQPEIIGTSDLFLTKLSQAAGLEFSTLLGTSGGTVEGTSIALAPGGNILVGANATALGLPVSAQLEPLPVATSYAMVLSFANGGGSINYSTVIGDGRIRALATDSAGHAWVAGPIYDLAGWPLTDDMQHVGTGFVSALDANGNLQYSTRLGGIAAYASTTQQSQTSLAGIAVASDGTVATAGGWSLLTDSGNLDPENFDLPYAGAPNAALPGTLPSAVAPAICSSGNGGGCGAGYVAELGANTAIASLALSVDTLPNLTLRNAGQTSITVTNVSATGYAASTDCTFESPLTPGSACDVVLAGNGPGAITVTTGSGSFTWTLAGAALSSAQNSVSVQPKELVFNAADAAAYQQQSLTISNFSSQTQVAEVSAANNNEYALIDDSASTACVDAGYPYYTINSGTDCTIAALFNDPAQYAQLDGAQQDFLTLNLSTQPTNAVEFYGYSLAEGSHGINGGLVFSTTAIAFGTQYLGQPTTPRSVVITNATGTATPLAFLSTPASDPNFVVTDLCPATLQPHSSCVVLIAYSSAYVSSDNASLTLPNGQSLELTGNTAEQPGAGGLSANPNISVSPASVTFGAVGIGDSTAAQPVTVSNTGSAATGITITTSAGFSQTNNCGGAVPANGSCIVEVSYKPTQLGVVHGQLTVTPTGASPIGVALTGGGTTSISFPTIVVGQQATQWISQGSYIGGISASVDGQFQVAVVNGYQYTSPPTISFGASASGACTQNCYVGVRAVPTVSGSLNGTLTITQGSTTTTYPIAASSLLNPPALLNMTSYDFGPGEQNQASAPAVFTLTNPGSSAVAVSGISVSSSFAESSNCGSTLAAGGSCSVFVTFVPASTGAFTGTLSATAGGYTLTAALTGTATASSTGLAFSPAFLLVTSPGGAYSQTVTVQNTATVSRTITYVYIGGANYLSESDSCSGTTLAAGATCSVHVTAASIPAAALTQASLNFDVTVGGSTITATVPITVAPAGGGNANPSLAISPASLTFPPTAVGQASNPEYLTLTNNTSTSQTYTFQAPAGFSVDTSACALEAGGSCTVPVRFLPQSAGPIAATLSDAGISIAITGYGVPATRLAAPAYPSLIQPIALTAISGTNFEQQMTITNAGSGTLTFGSIAGPGAIVANSCTAAGLAPGESCALTLLTSIFQNCGDVCPSQPQSATITLLTNADSSPDIYTVNQTISSDAPQVSVPGMTLSTRSITFPQTDIGSSASQTFQVMSTGTGSLALAFVSSGDFSESDQCNGSLSGGGSASCNVTVTFAPTAGGFRSGTLKVVTNAGIETVTLAGNGPAATGPAATTTSLAASSYSVTQGNSITLTATVATSTGTPTGTVGFYADGSLLTSVALNKGTASFTASTSPYPPGTYTITARYNGDSSHNISTSPAITVALTSGAVATTTALSASPTSVPQGGSTTLSARVTKNSGSGYPTGTVNFLYAGTTIGSTTLVNGVATYTLSTAGYATGSYSVQAAFAGDSGDKPSTSSAVTVAVTAGKSATSVALSANPSSPVQGQNVTLTATVTGSSPTGSITFYYGSTPLGSATVKAGVASLTANTSAVPAGAYQVKGSYSGDSGNEPSVSPVITVQLRSATTTSVKVAPATVKQGQTATLTATVKRSSGSGPPAGDITFYANGAAVGSVTLSSGAATLNYQTNSSTAKGTYAITATYLGSATDGASSSGPASLTVQ